MTGRGGELQARPAGAGWTEHTEAAAASVRRALGGGGIAAVNTAAELAAVAAALPPGTSIWTDPVVRIPEGAEPGDDWRPSAVATLQVSATWPDGSGPGRPGGADGVLVAGVELGTWLLPPGTDTPAADESGRAWGPYDRFAELAGDRAPVGEGLRAAGALLSHIAGLLADGGLAQWLPAGSPVAATITWQAGQLAELAAAVASLATLADEDAGDGDTGDLS
ncbi:MAG TPA: hypothetical protein VGM53_35545 [Streptosporangiaceae bacterium]|jgi:hypothetical protein